MYKSQVHPLPDHATAWPTTVQCHKVTPDLRQLPSFLPTHPLLRDAGVQPFSNCNHHHSKYLPVSLQLLFQDLFSRLRDQASELLFIWTCLKLITKVCYRGFRRHQGSTCYLEKTLKGKLRVRELPGPVMQSQGQEPGRAQSYPYSYTARGPTKLEMGSGLNKNLPLFSQTHLLMKEQNGTRHQTLCPKTSGA